MIRLLPVLIAVVFFTTCKAKLPEAVLTKYFHDSVKQVELNQDERTLIVKLREVLKKESYQTPDVDDALVAAARNLARRHFQRGAEALGRTSNDAVQQALYDAGVSDARVFTHYSTAPDLDFIQQALDRAVVEEFGQESYSHMGVGVIKGGFPSARMAVVLFTRRIAHLELFPKFIEAENPVSLQGRLEPGYQELKVLVTRPDGRTIEIKPALDSQKEFIVSLPLTSENKGRYIVEVEASAEGGPEVASLFPVDYLIRSRPTTYHSSVAARKNPPSDMKEKEPILTEREAEVLLIELINNQRMDAGQIPLMEEDRLREMARGHSRDMSENQFARHVSPSTGDLVDRVKKANIAYLKVGENIAINTSIDSAHRSLMTSPAHRQNILDPEYRYLGVGVTRQLKPSGQVLYLITENFADFP